MIHRIVTSVSCAIFLCISVLALGASPAQAQDIDRESTSLVHESESAQAQDKKGFLVFLRETPSKEQIQALNKRGADLSLGSWIPPSGSEETGFLYVRALSSNISSVADLPFVTNYRDASMIETEGQGEQALQSKTAKKRARLNPYEYRRTESTVLKLHAIHQARSPESAKEWAAGGGWSTIEGKVKVAIESLGDGPAPTDLIRSLGGTIDLTYQGTRFAWVPTENLKELADSLGEDYRVRMPRVPQQQAIDSEGVTKTEADKYHQKGLKGDDVTVGIIDRKFDRIPDADLPSNVVKLDCTRVLRSGCGEENDLNSTFDNFLIAGTHGTAAAEIVADMAPEATLRLYLITDEADLAEAVSDGLNNGVDVFSHSIGFYTTPWHDDEGTPESAANDASEGGSLFFTSAGNEAERHWQGSFRDDNGDNQHEWDTEDEVNNFTLAEDGTVEVNVRWNNDDNSTDYNLDITDDNGQPLTPDRTESGETHESLRFENNSGNARDLGIGIEQVSGDGNFEVFVRGPVRLGSDPEIEYFMSESSVSPPASATKDNVISVGAVDQSNFTKFNSAPIFYSGQGPTNDENRALDVTGPTNTSTSGSDIAGGSFRGTSAATPHAAGGAAILWDAKAESGSPSASEVRQDLLDAARNERDWGKPGVDSTFGHGGLFLPDFLDDLQITFNETRASLFPLVTSVVTVTDSDGNVVTGLDESGFSAQEEGVSENITNVNEIRQSGGSVSSSLVLDRSGSMGGGALSDAKNAAKTFVDQLMSGDQASVISFSNGVTVDQPFTSDAAALKSAIDNLSSGGGTALYDGIVRGVQEIELETNSPAVLALTDGLENQSSNSKQDAIDVANQAGVPVYTIGLGSGVNTSDLQDVADQTGGRFFQAPSSSDLETVYEEIS